ncbi:MAG: ketoacyl-ACP synthase III [Deltaproteobacteria bacterium]|nr:ketoacyl-ACP synthase III [Deltaproteobacteria bacterium]
MPNAYISGTGFYVPPRVVTNDQLVEEYGMDTSHEWIVKRTGIEERRFAEEGVGTADLATEASRMAIEDAGLETGDIDMIVFATLSPEHAFPGSGVYLQRNLGFADLKPPKFVPALDVRNQCSGFLYGLATAASMVQAGGVKHVLLVGAEIQSAGIDLTTRGRTVSSLFGDGAGAVVVSPTDEDRGVRGWWLGADGRFADALSQKVWDVRRRPFLKVDAEGNGFVPVEDVWAHMNGKVVFKHAVEKMILVMMQACWEQKITVKDIDLFYLHQANMRINQYVAKQLGLPDEKVVYNIQKYGNTTAATIPLMLAESQRDGRLQRGMKIALVAFGSGFTWGSAILDW